MLVHNPTETVAWLRLAEATLGRIVLFKKRRGGEMSRMTMSQYSKETNWEKESTEELRKSLSATETKIASKLKLIQNRGNRGRTVPGQCQSY